MGIRTRIASWCVAIAAIAVVIPHSSAQADEPSAEDLLARARAGKSVLGPSDGPGSSQSPVSLGLGIGRLGVVSELTGYGSDKSAYGAYLGVGAGSWYGDFVGIRTLSVHAGLALRGGQEWQFGAGLEYDSAKAIVHWTPSSAAASEHLFTPHGWVEYGASFGPAIRLQVSPVSPAISVHWRGGPR